MHNKGNNNNNNSTTSNLNINILTNSSTVQASASSPSGVGGSTIITDRIEWSRATILDFIEDYRRQRVLWDPNTKGYHIKQTKYEALKSLGHKYGAEIRSIRSKIKSLRSSFHREHGKVLNSRRKGHNYQPMWFAYDAIRFILDGEAGDFDEAETKNDLNTIRETKLEEPTCNSNTHHHHLNIDEELMEEKKISSRDIEHFNNHFLALGLQARNPMAVIAAVEAAAAATAAQERRQEQENALRQHQQLDTATQLKLLELTTIAANNNNNKTNTKGCTLISSSTANQFNPISKSISSPKPTSPLPLALSVSTPVTTTTTSLSSVTIKATPLPQPSATNTCSSESLNVLHGSRSLDENSALAAATAIPSLSITAVARSSDFDSNEYCNISADDVKTEIFESDSNELAMLESARASTPVPLDYQKNATDLTINRNNTTKSNSTNNVNMSRINCDEVNTGNSRRKRKAQTHSNLNVNYNKEDAPSSSKFNKKRIQQQQKQLQHSNAIHSKQCNYLNNNNHNIIANNLNSNQNHIDISLDNDEDNEDDADDDDGGDEINYSTSFSHLQTTLINAGNNNTNNGGNPLSSQNLKINNNNNSTPIDEYGVFGEYVAITIRKLKTSKAKIVVKHLINNLLYEAEMGKYDQGISSSKEPPELYKM